MNLLTEKLGVAIGLKGEIRMEKRSQPKVSQELWQEWYMNAIMLRKGVIFPSNKKIQ